MMITQKQWTVARRTCAGMFAAGIVAALLVFASAPIDSGTDDSKNNDFPTIVETNNATDITGTTATLNGTLNEMGDMRFAGVEFQWGEDNQYSNKTRLKAMYITGTFSACLEGLKPDTRYCFRAKAISTEYSYGKGMQFTTLN